MTLQAWPFLVARGQEVGYQVVVTPGLDLPADAEAELTLLAGAHPTAEGQWEVRPLGAPGGDLMAVFRQRTADWADLGLTAAGSEDAIPLDGSGRPTPLVLGFVVVAPGDDLARHLVTEEAFRRAQEACAPAFAALWTATHRQPPERSDPFPIAGPQRWEATEQPAPLVRPAFEPPAERRRLAPGRSVPGRRPGLTRRFGARRAVIGTVLALLGVSLVISWLGGHRQQPSAADAGAAQTARAFCAAVVQKDVAAARRALGQRSTVAADTFRLTVGDLVAPGVACHAGALTTDPVVIAVWLQPAGAASPTLLQLALDPTARITAISPVGLG